MSDDQKRRGRPPKVREVAPEDMREAGPNAAEQGSEPEVAAAVIAPAVEAVAVVSLAGWIKEIERDTPPMLVAVSHPDAVAGIYEGKYSGIRLTTGPVEAAWSDGSKT